jgi:hypothetical protein
MKDRILKILRKTYTPDGEHDDDEMCAIEIIAYFQQYYYPKELFELIRDVAKWNKIYSSTNLKLRARELYRRMEGDK